MTHRRTLSEVFPALLVIVLLQVACFYPPTWLRTIDAKLRDVVLSIQQPPIPAQHSSLVAIDPETVALFKQWPFPRLAFAVVHQKLLQAGAADVIYDVIFMGEDRASPSSVTNFLKIFGYNARVTGIPEGVENFDTLLSQELMEGRSVIGFLPNSLYGDAWRLFRSYDNVTKAHVDVAVDGDGKVRSSIPVFADDKRLWPSLSLAAYLRYNGKSADPVKNFSIIGYRPREQVPFRLFKPDTVSFKDVFSGTFDTGMINGRVVFVGVTDYALNDHKETPWGLLPGVQLHLSAFETFLQGTIAPVQPLYSGIAVFIIGCLSLFVFQRVSPGASMAVLTFMLVVLTVAMLLLTGQKHVWPLWGSIMMEPVAVMLAVISSRIIVDRMRVAQFARYVAPEVMDRIISADIDNEQPLQGERRRVSVLFSDLRGFTAMSEKLDPRDVQHILSTYFDPMVRTVRQKNGMVDKFVGDALMAVWNGPRDVPNHETLALEAAFSMLEAIPFINAALKQPILMDNGKMRRLQNITLRCGIGINVGDAFAGNMGTKDICSYTVLGDTVNTASRYESLCPEYGTNLLVTPNIRTALLGNPHYCFLLVDIKAIKGKAAPMPVYAPRVRPGGGPALEAYEAWLAMEKSFVKGDLHEAVRNGETALATNVLQEEYWLENAVNGAVPKNLPTLSFQRFLEGITGKYEAFTQDSLLG